MYLLNTSVQSLKLRAQTNNKSCNAIQTEIIIRWSLENYIPITSMVQTLLTCNGSSFACSGVQDGFAGEARWLPGSEE